MGHDHSHMEHIVHGIDAMNLVGFWSILSFSFLVSLHCVGMCGPLVCAKLGPRATNFGSSLWTYNLGRLVSYAIAGFALGRTSSELSDNWSLLGKIIAGFLGVILVVQGIGYLYGKKVLKWQIAMPAYFGVVLKNTQSLPMLARDFIFGLATVLLPCMTLTPALIAAAASASGIAGLAVMVAFFAGTLPAMIFAPALLNVVGNLKHRESLQKFGGIFLILTGTITILRIWH